MREKIGLSSYLMVFLIFLAVILSIAHPVFCEEEFSEEIEGVEEAGSTYSIKEYLEEALPPNDNRRVVLDETTGMLTVTDTPGNQNLVRELVKLWDVGTKQVRIQARFVEIAVNSIGELGAEWVWRRAQDGTGKREAIEIDAVTPPVDSTAATFGGANETSGLGLEIGKSFLTGSKLLLYIKALEEEGKANLLSSPAVTTLSGQMANIQLANILPYAVEVERTNIGTSVTPVFVEKYKVMEKATGITLEVTPKVSGDGKIITMDIHPEVTVLVKQVPISSSTDFPTGLGYPVIDSRSAQTSVVIRSGQTVVLGGLIREDETVTIRKTPILGDIPLFGYLFRTKHIDKTKRNLVIFLTATIIDSRGEPVI
ncbi:MAG: secretin N-terminal domain-containing protein [Candidatus Omnitrophota bacterium]